jgi:hypothetical protein
MADRGCAFAAEYAIERTVGVAEQLLGNEGGAVATSVDETVGQPLPCYPDEVEDLRHIGQVVEGEANRLGPPPIEQSEIVLWHLDL